MSTNFEIYHYTRQDFNDVGFGCSYRNIQNILSCLSLEVPHITELFEFFDKDYKEKIQNRQTKKLWIEPFQISEYFLKSHKIGGENLLYVTAHIDYNNILRTDLKHYINSDLIFYADDFDQVVKKMEIHFSKTRTPIVIDDGTFSYCILSINYKYVKILDPHKLESKNTVYIRPITFLKNSFWMIYIPNR